MSLIIRDHTNVIVLRLVGLSYFVKTVNYTFLIVDAELTEPIATHIILDVVRSTDRPLKAIPFRPLGIEIFLK